MGARTPSVVVSPAPEHTVGGDVPGDRWMLHLGPLTCEGRAVRMEGDMGVSGASSPSGTVNQISAGSLGSFFFFFLNLRIGSQT